MRQYPTIGVLGGMGPEATILLQQRLLKAVDVDGDQDHIPLLIDMNPQVPSRIDHLLRRGQQDPGPVLAMMARRLEAAGAVILAMPCNTAHHYASEICEAASIPMLNMPELAAQRIAEETGSGASIGILASPATKPIGLFEKALAPHDLTALHPSDQKAMLQAIERLKARGADDVSRRILQQAAVDCVRRGAAGLLVGCTEFSLIRDAVDVAVPVLDTLDCLIDAIVDFINRS